MSWSIKYTKIPPGKYRGLPACPLGNRAVSYEK